MSGCTFAALHPTSSTRLDVGVVGSVTCNMVGMQRRKPGSVRQRVQSHRARLRSQGMRPIQIWVPDVRSPEFAVEAHRQSVAIASSRHADEDQAFIDAASSEEE